MNTAAITSNPLYWPPGWKRVPKSLQKRAPFFSKNYSSYGKNSISIAQATRFVLDELKRMNVLDCNVIISSNLKLRMDGLPYSDQRAPDDVGVAVWWRDPKSKDGIDKVIACDQYDRVADNLYAVGKTIEALRGIERWGGAQILERTFAGFEALPAPSTGSPRPWREVLGVDDGENNIETVKGCFRICASKAHPDRGGSDERMAEVNRAWDEAQRELGG